MKQIWVAPRVFSLTCLLLATALLGLSAESITWAAPADERPPMKIGVITPLSGDFASYGALVRVGIESVPREGIELVFEDEGCDPKRAVTAYRKLVDVDRVRYLLGPSCGSPQQAIAPLLSRDGVLALVTSSATEKMFRLSEGMAYFAQYSIEQESTFIARTMNEEGFRRAAIVYFENEFSRAHEDAFRRAFKGEIGEVIRFPAFEASYVKGAALKIKHGNFDVLYVPDVSPFLLGLATELRRIGVREIPIYSVYSAQMKDLLAAEGPNAEGLRYSYPAIKERDAIEYFPALGARMVFAAAKACDRDTACAARYLREHFSFDERNVSRSEIELRTIRGGAFVRMAEEGERERDALAP